MIEDKNLSELEQFSGSMDFIKAPLFKTILTEGVSYVMSNGYSWLVTDALAVIEHEPKVMNMMNEEGFLSVKLKLVGSVGKMTIDDGNGNIIYTQDYSYTNAQRELKFFVTNGVMMLPSEY